MLKKLFILPIRFYQKYISPLKPPCCRFTPTCSQYAIDAVMEWGVLVGLLLAIGRVLRCNPLFRGGYDPVPENKWKRLFLEKRKTKKALKHEKKRAETEKNPKEEIRSAEAEVSSKSEKTG